MSKHHPMRITAHLRTGVMADAYLPLDGILYANHIRRAFGPEEVTLPGDMAQWGGGHTGLPLQRKMEHGIWFYACSFADWGEAWIDDRGFWTKRFDQQYADIIDFEKRRGVVTTAEGKYKGYQMPIFTRHALHVHWYAVGNLERVADLLCDVTHIGKKGAQGYGRVNGWAVEPWPEDWSVRRNGQLTRAIPAQQGTLYGVRPPYWKPGNQCACVMPDVA
jgi:CRISPR type IV-associated protein Csf3